jgi:DNA-directed RNA polymerase sigma subunit (sigma70/sigma32)
LDPNWVRNALKSWGNFLSEVERRALEIYCGLHDGKQRTLQQTGEELGVSKSRAQQIVAKGLRKLNGSENLERRRNARKQ